MALLPGAAIGPQSFPVGLLDDRLDQADGLADLLEKGLALGRWREATAPPVELLETDISFQIGNKAADTGLGDAQHFTRLNIGPRHHQGPVFLQLSWPHIPSCLGVNAPGIAMHSVMINS